jgi:hypothetical protein
MAAAVRCRGHFCWERGRETEKQRGRETEKQRSRETEKQRSRETEKQRSGETEKRRSGETEKQRSPIELPVSYLSHLFQVLEFLCPTQVGMGGAMDLG